MSKELFDCIQIIKSKENNSLQEKINAIKILEKAPGEDVWNKSLLNTFLYIISPFITVYDCIRKLENIYSLNNDNSTIIVDCLNILKELKDSLEKNNSDLIIKSKNLVIEQIDKIIKLDIADDSRRIAKNCSDSIKNFLMPDDYYKLFNTTLESCINRLSKLKTIEEQDRFLKALLDFCFLNLNNDSENTRKIIIDKITDYLLFHPFEFENHRSRLLSRNRKIQYMFHQEKFANSVINSQKEFSNEGDRSDSKTVEELTRHRKFHVYVTSGIPESTLLGYLQSEYEESVNKINREWFRVYRKLLNIQTQGNAKNALLQAFKNLSKWAQELPQEYEKRKEVYKSIELAAKQDSWNGIELPAQRHIESHMELLTGSDDQEDIFNLLKRRYIHPNGENVLIKALNTLKYLPGIRNRIDEICAFVNQDELKKLSVNTWKAILDLLEKIALGLPDFVINNDNKLTQKEKKEILSRAKILEYDVKLRELLYKLSYDNKLDKSIREKAWRILLQSLPYDYLKYYIEGLSDLNNELFLPTLQEAGEDHVRETWDIIKESWEKIISRDAPKEKRLQIITELCKTLLELRNYAMVCHDNEKDEFSVPPLIGLALDDKDSEVKKVARETITKAGYQSELQREEQKRKIYSLRQELTKTNLEIINTEKRIDEIINQINQQRLRKTEIVMMLQGLFQERSFIETEGWITTARIQVDLKEVQLDLIQALKDAREQEGLLENLRKRMTEQLKRCQEAYRDTEAFVRAEEHCENTINDLNRQLNRANNDISNAQREMNSLNSELYSLRKPSAPYERSDTDVQDRYSRELGNYERSYKRLLREINQNQNTIDSCQIEKSNCNNQISRIENERNQLRDQIDGAQRRNRELEKRLNNIGKDYSKSQASLQEIRNRINCLSEKVDILRRDLNREVNSINSKMASNTSQIHKNQTGINDISELMKNLSSELNENQDNLNRLIFRATALKNDLDSGISYYDQISQNAVIKSAQANAEGISLQNQHNTIERESQESLLWYSQQLNKAVERRREIE